ncbi:MAG: hypothetical protein SPK94_08050 [Bacteroidales bacterium]|nr:hypothetical protein [Bacteroidales bacterium]
MFFEAQPKEEKAQYENLLKIMGALSRLSSDSDVPYLYYRMAENIFCKAFNAINLARSDISLDAKKMNIGLGLKTFINKNAGSIEKIAEFNKNRSLIDKESSLKNKILLISRLRNERLKTTGGIAEIDLSRMFYHCVLREKGKFIIHEDQMLPIAIENIKELHETGDNTVLFSDGNYEYSFNFSKSTLYKRFISNPIHEIPIQIFDDPYRILENALADMFPKLSTDAGEQLVKQIKGELPQVESQVCPAVSRIYLPLYSFNRKKGKFVPEKSGLNQWNAGGRARNYDEVYIPIPRLIHRKFPNFFPERDTSFTLRLPSGSFLVAKICQDGGKALMSNPNSALGEWLLRTVLGLKEGELLTYQKLEEIGIDSVEITKFSDDTYDINFKQLGTFGDFESNISLEEDEAE